MKSTLTEIKKYRLQELEATPIVQGIRKNIYQIDRKGFVFDIKISNREIENLIPPDT